MKSILLATAFALAGHAAGAQSVAELPAGTYETKTAASASRWEKGDIILLDEGRYRLSTGAEVGEYKFSVAAQRLFFTSGPLKSAYTKVALADGKPVIILPQAENSGLGLRAEVWASRQ